MELLKAAYENDNRLSVLDFGGLSGSSYFQNREMLSELEVSENGDARKVFEEFLQAQKDSFYLPKAKNKEDFVSLKDMIKLVTPPVFIHVAKWLRGGRKNRIDWEYIPEGWAYAETHPEVKGWNLSDVLETYKKKWPKFVAMVQGTGPLGIAHESDMTTNENINNHNEMMAFAYVLALVTRHKNRISMLDWGGGIGHYYLLAQALLPGIEIEYHCKDVPVLSEYGAQLFPHQHFYSDEYCFKRTYDVVLASTSIHYTEDWRTLLQRLAGVTRNYLYIANLPSVQKAASFVFVQRPYQYGYNTEYLSWCLNRTEFLRTAKCTGLKLMREFVYGQRPFIYDAPEQNVYRGYLFRIHQGGRV